MRGWCSRPLPKKAPPSPSTFETAAGLEAGKTKIKFKDVVVGQVESIDFGENLQGVVLTAELQREAKSYLTENTRFWVVRARLAAGEVRGLGTLFSGAYIGMEPEMKGVKSWQPVRTVAAP